MTKHDLTKLADNAGKDDEKVRVEQSTRRSVIRNIGISAISLSTLGAGTSAARRTLQNTNGTSSTEDPDTPVETDGQDQDGAVQAQAITGGYTSFSPYQVTVDEDSILQGSWSLQSPIPVSNYQLDILVNAEHIGEPRTVSHNLDPSDITKEWEYRSSSPAGPAYHWQAKVWESDMLGTERKIEAIVSPHEAGEVEAKTGTFWPWQSWTNATLLVDW